METLENKSFLASDSTIAENILYYGCNILLLGYLLVAFFWGLLGLIDGEKVQVDWIVYVTSLVTVVFSWAIVMVFLKISNLLRHIYNRLDDLAEDSHPMPTEEE